jgi:tetrahedral aminopeptidase
LDALTETLAKLSQLAGPSGYEDEARNTIVAEAKKYTDHVEVDAIGNVYATVNGSQQSKVLVDAHMDEVGFIVKYVEDRGFIRFETLGTIDPRIMPGKRIIFKGSRKDYPGTIGSKPPHIISGEEANRITPQSDLFMDIGMDDVDAVKSAGIFVGSIGTFDEPFRELGSSRVMGKAFDDRAGCTIGLSVMEALSKEKPKMSVVFAFTVQEELGMRGAEVASKHVNPDLAIALETTVAADVPDTRPRDWITQIGLGPSIRVMDSSMVAQRVMVNYLRETAEKNNIPHQMQLAKAGGTDAGKIHLSGASGVPTGLISTPCRYLHGPSSILSTEDLRNGVRLTEAAIHGMESRDQFKL